MVKSDNQNQPIWLGCSDQIWGCLDKTITAVCNGVNNPNTQQFNLPPLFKFLPSSTVSATQAGADQEQEKQRDWVSRWALFLYGASQWDLLSLTSEKPISSTPTWHKQRPTIPLKSKSEVERGERKENNTRCYGSGARWRYMLQLVGRACFMTSLN